MSGPSWTFEQAERYLLSLELFGVRFGLDRMRRLMTVLDSPQLRFAAVHVVGTNGKSSTARMTASLLRCHGLRTGAYLSPHLSSFAERIEIQGRQVSPEQFAAAVQSAAHAAALVNRSLAGDDHVTQFEALTAAAYFELARSRVEAAVIEAGLGARYDATSVIEPRVVVLTNVGLEHRRWLGPTEQHIAEEKLALVPSGGTIVAGPLGADALAVAERTARERKAILLLAGRDFHVEDEGEAFAVRTPLQRHGGIVLRPLGSFQRMNFAAAACAAEAFLGRLDTNRVREAARLRLPGRLEVVEHDPLVVLDGAHNPHAAVALRASLEPLLAGRKLTAVISILDDKDAAAVLSVLLPVCERVVFTRSTHQRALPPATLESLSRQLGGPPAELAGDPSAALSRAREIARAEGAVLVTGSIYLLSDLVRLAEEGRSRVSR